MGSTKKSSHKYKRRIIKYVFWLIVLIIVSGMMDAWITYRAGPRTTIGRLTLTDKYGNIITNKGKSGGYQVTYTQDLSTPLVHNIIAIEDARFYHHYGIDVYGKIASLIANIKAGRIVRGGSTITEQYVKNVYFPGAPRTFLQKIRESFLSLIIDLNTTKDDILRGYLSHIYMGNGVYGISGINDTPINTIVRIKYPNIHAKNLEKVNAYRHTVAKKLNIHITGDSYVSAKKRYTNRYPLVTMRVESAIKQYCSGQKSNIMQWVEKVPNDLCENSYTNLQLTLDGRLQDIAYNIARNAIDALFDKKISNASIYIIHPKSKKILTYIGTIMPGDQVDMITRRRSVGSVLKPFIYLLALKDGADTEQYILDETVAYPSLEVDRHFVPENYNPKSYGPVKLREALGNSLNTATVRLTEFLRVPRVYSFLRTMGLDLDRDVGHYGHGISIGTVEATLQNIVESYIHLTDMSDPDVWLIFQALRDPRNRARTFGFSSILNSSVPLPVKTGTSTDFRDNWTISYSPDAIIGVWVGNNDSSAMGDVSGVTGAGPIWHQIAQYMIAQGHIKQRDDNPPSSLQKQGICLDVACFQKEYWYTKLSKSPKSRPADHIYYQQDFVGNMTPQEMQKYHILQN